MSARSQAAAQAHATFGFHRDQHLGWRRVAVIVAAIAVLEAAALAGYILLHSTVYITIAATPDGRVIEAERRSTSRSCPTPPCATGPSRP